MRGLVPVALVAAALMAFLVLRPAPPVADVSRAQPASVVVLARRTGAQAAQPDVIVGDDDDDSAESAASDDDADDEPAPPRPPRKRPAASPPPRLPAKRRTKSLCADAMAPMLLPGAYDGQRDRYTFAQWCNESYLVPPDEWADERETRSAGFFFFGKKKE